MTAANDTARAIDALHAIPPDLPRPDWVKAGMAAQAAGLDFDTFDNWSAQAGNYNARDCRSAWRSFKPGKGVNASSLFHLARAHGWQGDKPQHSSPSKPAIRPPEPPRKPRPGMAPAEVWARCVPATFAHPYITAKACDEVDLSGLRVVPEGDPLHIAGQRMAGCLVVPAYSPRGELQSLQFIPPPGAGRKLNLPGASMAGASFAVGELVPGGLVYLAEGIGQAWACWHATGRAAVVAFGWANVGTIARELRQRDSAARLVLVPDVGKEEAAHAIARELGCAVAAMPAGEARNFDACDLAQRDGLPALAEVLGAAIEPAKPEPRYKLLGAADLRALPPLAWRVRGVLPAEGLAALYGPSASGKSFLALDMAAAVAEGADWFGHRTAPAPVVYVALEGEGGFRLRCAAWEHANARALPDGLRLVLQPFKLPQPQDVQELAAVVPAGAVVIVDTLNRAAPLADENSSRDMGEILEGAKNLQTLTGGLVVLVHHTGKDATRGLRGHSSLFAAMDAAVEVARDGDRREWRVAKSKDDSDGKAYPFRLCVQELDTDEHGEAVTSCTVQPDTAAQDVQRVKLPQGGNQRIAYDALRLVFKDKGRAGMAGAPPLRLCLELETAIASVAAALVVPPDRKTERARAAVTGLVSRGVLVCRDGWVWQA